MKAQSDDYRRADCVGTCTLDQNIFRYGLPVEHADNAMAKPCIMLTVGNHYYGGAMFIQFG